MTEEKASVGHASDPWEVPVLFSSPAVLLKQERMEAAWERGRRGKERREGRRRERGRRGGSRLFLSLNAKGPTG